VFTPLPVALCALCSVSCAYFNIFFM